MYRYVVSLLALGGVVAFAQSPEPLRTAGDRPIDIEHLELRLRPDIPKKTLVAQATLTFKTLRPLTAFTLDAVDFEVKEVSLDGKPAKFRHDGKHLTVDFAEPAKADQPGKLRVDYVVRDPQDGLFFFGPTKAEPDLPLTVWSQGEATSNRYWIPCLDHPAEMQTSELFATVPEGFEVLSNGKLVEKKVNDKTATFHWKQDKPHVSYLITFVVGKFAVVEEAWNGKPVTFYVAPKFKGDVARTFGRTREMLDFFSKRFGIDYPWDKYAQVCVEQFTAGGMENTGATTLTERAMHDERAFLDSDADGLIAHELAHQWWGDLVTCRDWSHLWLNEGWASFSEIIWDEHKLGADAGAYERYRKMLAALAGGKDRPIVDRRYADPMNMFDARAYPKGAWVLVMLRHQLGEEAFWKGVQHYGTVHRHQSVETADFRRALERVSGRSLERFFYDWTERPGAPVLEVNSEYLADTKQLRVTVKQTQAGDPFTFPLPIAVSPDPKQTPKMFTIEVKEKEQVFFTPPLDAAPELVLIDPELTVLAEIKESKGRDWWKAQLLHAKTIYPRIQASRHFGKSKSPTDRDTLAEAFKAEKYWGVAREIAADLAESGGDTSRDALIGGLQRDDPKVRRACAEQLGKFRRDETAGKALKALLAKGDASYFVEAGAIASYAKGEHPDAVNVLLPWLAKGSHAEVIRAAVLEGFGTAGGVDSLDTLIEWTKRGKAREVRVAALAALPKLAERFVLDDKQRIAILEAITTAMTGEGEMPKVRRAGVDALRSMGQSAATRLDVLDAIARHDTDERVREQARKAVKDIREKAPLPAEVNRLRDELETLRKSNLQLLERLDKVERKGK